MMINRVNLNYGYAGNRTMAKNNHNNQTVVNNRASANSQIAFGGIGKWLGLKPAPLTDEHIAKYLKANKDGSKDLEDHWRLVINRAKMITKEQWKTLEKAAEEFKKTGDEIGLDDIQEIAREAEHKLPDHLLPKK